MKIEKLPSGSYRIRKTYKGKTYTKVLDFKPTQKEAMQIMSALFDESDVHEKDMTIKKAMESYIDSKRNVLSPTTVREYTNSINRYSSEFLALKIVDVTELDIQKEINSLAKTRKPKTIRNYHAFISSVLAMFRPSLKISTTLPQKAKNEPYIPSTNDIKSILEYAKGTEYEIALLLACYGLRRSEICALTVDDVKECKVTINKAMVMDKNKKWIVKKPKTTQSEREIYISDYLQNLINEKGYIYKYHPNSITKYLYKVEKALNIPTFSEHKLRHYFCSKLLAEGIDIKTAQALGGWESDYVPRMIYAHQLDEKLEEAKKKASDTISKSLNF